MYTKTYETLNWPALPAEMELKLIQHLLDIDNPYAENIHPRNSRRKDTKFFWHTAPDYLVTWIKENLPAEVDDDFCVVLQVWRNTDTGKRHVDSQRKFSYNYVLGEHPAITRWFQAENDIEPVDQVQYQPGVWYKHYGKLHHDVIHVNQFRPAIAIFISERSHRERFLALDDWEE
jgi:hypothetical protein